MLVDQPEAVSGGEEHHMRSGLSSLHLLLIPASTKEDPNYVPMFGFYCV